MHIKKIQGYTLMELLTVLAIFGILASIALPSFVQQIKQDRLVTNANQLHSVYKFARSEAVKREKPISLIASGNQWSVTMDIGLTTESVLLIFTPTHDSISVSSLANMVISDTGTTDITLNALITDSDSATTDYCLDIFISGQSNTNKSDVCV